MKIALLIYFSSIICMGYSFPNNDNDKKTEETQSKRDTSYSYSAADINSKEGTHIKTITVIKNIDNKNSKDIKLNPIYHKHENWGGKIHENFEEFGIIPEVPDIDDLFEFTKNYKPIKPIVKPVKDVKPEISISEKPINDKNKENESENSTPKIVAEISTEQMKAISKKDIPDDVELINTETNLNLKSQSLQYVPQPQSSKRINVQIQPQSKYLTEYSTPQHSVRQYFITSEPGKSAEYKKIPLYMKPNYQNKTPVYSPLSPNYSNKQPGSGVGIETNKPPYLAPNNKFKKPQNNKSNTNAPAGFPESSQAPYLAPSIKKVQNNKKTVNQNGITSQTNSIQGQNNNQTNIITVPFNLRIGSNIQLGVVTRSRGLRY